MDGPMPMKRRARALMLARVGSTFAPSRTLVIMHRDH
jgi:hypothetical protein